ncbi:hypothetical protein DPMN_116135 [Dreissena polymorpha]|uniref:Uncharacterized protein n=1 Tax=Dreissena polymorpha TaxID=45954 RepID=A0A9D4KNA7_DREPO|nr:hypothetical protein DPMN_116135 [Dreissena polymorpha]
MALFHYENNTAPSELGSAWTRADICATHLCDTSQICDISTTKEDPDPPTTTGDRRRSTIVRFNSCALDDRTYTSTATVNHTELLSKGLGRRPDTTFSLPTSGTQSDLRNKIIELYPILDTISFELMVVDSEGKTTDNCSYTAASMPAVTLTPAILSTPVFRTTPANPSTPAVTTMPAIPSTPAVMTTQAIPSMPAITTTPAISSTPAVTTTPAIPSTPTVTTKPAIPSTPAFTTTQARYHSSSRLGNQSALLRLINDLLDGMEKQEVTALIAIDLSAAFDTANVGSQHSTGRP